MRTPERHGKERAVSAFAAVAVLLGVTAFAKVAGFYVERGRMQFALFDFDGTISLIREGWQQVMIPMMVELLSATGTEETAGELEGIVSEYVTRLTGKQTIYQMIELAEQIRRRGGRAGGAAGV